MPTPNSFTKNFIVWVDDKPKNNTKLIASFQKIGIEVLQLTSTLMAKMWTNEFTWLLNWIDVKFKVISDMVRKQGANENYEAGIDLLQHFYNIKNYTTPILIYCGD